MVPARGTNSTRRPSVALLVEAVIVSRSTLLDLSDPPGPLAIDQRAEHPEGARKTHLQNRVGVKLDPQPAIVVVGFDSCRGKTSVQGPARDDQKPLAPRAVETPGPGPEAPGDSTPPVPGLGRHTA